MARFTYIKLFKDPEIEARAIKMINEGFSFTFIGRLLRCDRTSVMALKKRKMEAGMVFKNVGDSLDRLYRRGYIKIKKDKQNIQQDLPIKKEVNNFEDTLKVNKGKTYAEYLKIEKKKTQKSRNASKRRALETLRKVRLKREKEGYYKNFV